MSAKDKLNALKSAFEKKSSGTGGGDQSWKLFYPFWKAEVDTTSIVRFLPDVDPENPLQFLAEKLQHELHINGQKKTVPCLAMHGEDCPICNLSRKYYDEKNEDMGKKYYRKKSYVGQVIVIESPIEHDQSQLVKLIEFGPAVFKQIMAAFQSGDLEDVPYSLKGGYNFRIKKSKDGKYASYTTSSFAPKQSDLEDEVIEQLNLYNLADYRGEKMNYAAVEALLLADQTGAAMPAGHGDDETPPAAAKPTPPQGTIRKESEAPAKPAEEAPAASPKGNSVLEQLRARAKAKAAETAE